MEAFDALPEDLRQKTKLVLVGNGSPERVSAFREQYASPNIVHLQNVSDCDLAALMNRALGLAFVSLFEGFGIPLVEAMACGCPVITSNTTSMPEIAGDAALLVDPYDTSDVRAALERHITDGDLREHLRQRALDRSKYFSWDRCALETHAAYEAALRR
jgi:glycosyltransferase involved in cell wall biosynthesis